MSRPLRSWSPAPFVGTATLTLALAAVAPFQAFAQEQAGRPGQRHEAGAHDHRFRPEDFERPDRDLWQKPDELVQRLKLAPGQMVADIGAGSGYFSRRLAQAVGPAGRVYAVDIDGNMLSYIANDAAVLGLNNIVPVLATPDRPMLAPASVDLIFICNTIHHVAERPDYYRHLLRALRPKGRLVIVEFFKRPLPVGPPVDMKIAEGDLAAELAAGGFRLVQQEVSTLPYQYVQTYEIDRERRHRAEWRRQVGHLISQGRALEQIAGELQPTDESAGAPQPSPDELKRIYDERTTLRLPAPSDPKRPRALALIADRFHEPAHIEIGLSKAFAAAGIDAAITVDVRHLSAENLKQVDLFVILRDGMMWPDGHDKPYVKWMTEAQQNALAKFVDSGGAFLALHNCTGLYPPNGPYYEVLAGQYRDHSPIEPFHVEVADTDHPITQGISAYRINDEQHWPTFDQKRAHLILRSRSRHGEFPAGWAYENGQGRVCYLANGHTPEAIEHPMYQRLMVNAMHWCLRQNAEASQPN